MVYGTNVAIAGKGETLAIQDFQQPYFAVPEGTATEAYHKTSDGKDLMVAEDGTPNTSGQGSKWTGSKPVEIDLTKLTPDQIKANHIAVIQYYSAQEAAKVEASKKDSAGNAVTESDWYKPLDPWVAMHVRLTEAEALYLRGKISPNLRPKAALDPVIARKRIYEALKRSNPTWSEAKLQKTVAMLDSADE